MFKLFTVIRPAVAPVQPETANNFNSYAVRMPANLMEALQKRIYTVLLHKFYDCTIPHDLSTNHLIELDDFFLSQLTKEEHNLVIDALQLSLLKRFLQAEREVVIKAKMQLVPALTNTEYWTLAGELLASSIRPTLLSSLSLFP